MKSVFISPRQTKRELFKAVRADIFSLFDGLAQIQCMAKTAVDHMTKKTVDNSTVATQEAVLEPMAENTSIVASTDSGNGNIDSDITRSTSARSKHTRNKDSRYSFRCLCLLLRFGCCIARGFLLGYAADLLITPGRACERFCSPACEKR